MLLVKWKGPTQGGRHADLALSCIVHHHCLVMQLHTTAVLCVVHHHCLVVHGSPPLPYVSVVHHHCLVMHGSSPLPYVVCGSPLLPCHHSCLMWSVVHPPLPCHAITHHWLLVCRLGQQQHRVMIGPNNGAPTRATILPQDQLTRPSSSGTQRRVSNSRH